MISIKFNGRVSEGPDGSITIKWNDYIYASHNKIFKLILVIIIGFGLMISWNEIRFLNNYIPLLFVAFIGYVGWGSIRSGMTQFRNRIIIGPDFIVTRNGRTFNLDEISRFEYGKSGDLSGEPYSGPRWDKHDRPMNPWVVRMWIGDSEPVPIALNFWGKEENHWLRHEMETAWKAKRKAKSDEAQEQRFGKVGDDGIPDYD